MRAIMDRDGVYFNFDMCETVEIVIEEDFENFFYGCIKCTLQSSKVHYFCEDDEGNYEDLYNRLENELHNIIYPLEIL